jgi:hypothetical protein
MIERFRQIPFLRSLRGLVEPPIQQTDAIHGFLAVLLFRPFALWGEMARFEAATELSLTRGRISFAKRRNNLLGWLSLRTIEPFAGGAVDGPTDCRGEDLARTFTRISRLRRPLRTTTWIARVMAASISELNEPCRAQLFSLP